VENQKPHVDWNNLDVENPFPDAENADLFGNPHFSSFFANSHNVNN
jgi:hypothetical protein